MIKLIHKLKEGAVMGKVNVKLIEYKNFGKCIEISNSQVQVIVTVDIGPRIINYSFIDGENIMFEDLERAVKMTGEEFACYGNKTWYLYGGHRLWTSPEGPVRSKYPDNDAVSYEILENGAVFSPDEQVWNQYKFEIEVLLDEDSTEVTLIHRITNCGAWNITLAPWAITVLSPGGIEIVPQATTETDLLPNRVMAFWPYTNLKDERMIWGKSYLGLISKPEIKQNFKFGTNNEHGFSMYFNHGDLLIKKFAPKANGNYPDGGMSFETYVAGPFIEIESLGELTELAPSETVSHTEYWTLFKEDAPNGLDEEKIDELVKKYV